MGYDVTIVSTTEEAVLGGVIPFYKQSKCNIIELFNGEHIYPYEDKEFVLYQAENGLIKDNGIIELIDYIQNVNPYFVMYIGGRSYVADIINDFCPVITVSTVFSSISNGNTDFAIVGRKVNEEERKKYNSEIIEVPFTFTLTEKKKTFTRAELGIPEENFTIVVVGNRLDADVTKEFIECIKQVDDIFVVFIGKFDMHKNYVELDEWYGNNTMATGDVKDVMGVLEQCDLYVNPKRLGGGFSVIEAFHAGMPAVSINYGDVSVAAGEEFCVKDYDEMIEVINRYKTDKKFYDMMLEKGKQREAYITDGDRHFKEGIAKILNSKNFF